MHKVGLLLDRDPKMIQKRCKPDYTRTIRFKSFLMFLGKIYCEYFRYLICYYLADGSIEVREGIQLFIFKPFNFNWLATRKTNYNEVHPVCIGIFKSYFDLIQNQPYILKYSKYLVQKKVWNMKYWISTFNVWKWGRKLRLSRF